VRSVVDDKRYASAAELYVEAEAMVPRTHWWISRINTDHHYRIREKQSKLCLHYQTNQSEGHFCLGQFKEDDQSYIFTFEQAPGFTAFYRVKADGHYMAYDSSTSWRIISQTTRPTDKNGYIQVERLPEGNAYLRCAWQDSRLVGVNSKTAGSYIYADKTTPVEFILEDIEEMADDITSPSTEASFDGGEIYNLLGQRLNKPHRGINIIGGKRILMR